MVKISLIRPIYKTTAFDPEIQEPLGIETLAGFLVSNGHQVQVLDPILTGQAERHISRQAAAFHPSIIGFSIMNAGELESANRLIQLIRGYDPTITFVAGGNLPSTEPLMALDGLPQGTLCIRFEGELPFLGLVEVVERSLPVTQVGSLVFRNENARIIETADLSPMSELDDLPFAARPFIGEVLHLDLATNIQGSRGCVGTCIYCCAPGFPGSLKGRRRDKSPIRIVDEIQSIVETSPVRIFNFVDDDFLGADETSGERAELFANEINKRGLKISFGIQARPSTLKKDTIHLLASAGLSYVFFGVETDEISELQRWGRKQPPFDLSSLVYNLREYNIEAQAGCIPFHPDSSLHAIKRLAETLNANGLLNYRTATNRLQALPGSAMYRELEKPNKADKQSPGPYLPEFTDPGIDLLYQSLLKALEPLRPVWLYAAVKLPVVKARSMLNETGADKRYLALQETLKGLNDQISKTLFHLIERFETGEEPEIDLEGLRSAAFQVAMEMNRKLFKAGLVISEERLREIVSVESGL